MGRFVCCVSSIGFLALSGCAGPGLLTDGSSVSHGNTSTGALRDGTTLPYRGDGYFVPKRWRDRQRNYGTDELVRLMVRAARRVNREHRGSLLSIADISPRGGGATLEHKSHRSGRDVDLVFYHLDDKGKPIKATQMLEFDKDGITVPPKPTSQPATTLPNPPGTVADATPASQPTDPPPVRKLDIPRNWALVKALVLDPMASVQWIFIGRPAARLLLRHARRKKEPAYIIERAATVMHHQHAHMDHIHVRVFCAPSDRRLGCVDIGPSRWLKKDIKYIDSPPMSPTVPKDLLARLGLRPLRFFGRF